MSDSTNINVVVRCRGRNDREIQSKSPIIIAVPNITGSNELHINTSKDTGVMAQINSKTYTVDQVYGPNADQKCLFKGVAEPLFKEFLNGFNCTIFAYGQTGTGKTYTMCGDDKDINGSYSPEAGIIPRVLYELFEKLSVNDDFIVKCSFIELYNEELKDLLNDDLTANKLRIFESKTGMGNSINKSSIHIQNLDEVIIRDAHHGLKILQKGLKLRKVASTKLNDESSRSHTIFTLNLYKNHGNEEYKFSKMNLVDLAGSENINRSGAVFQRAREAGSINQSLLTLGRVINCLSNYDSKDKEKERDISDKHVPYRESKLTRLLQDSLGGNTKTVLIATVSPARSNIEETSSTLEYASKAKNIKNKPQVGNIISKNLLIKEIGLELSKLKSDLSSTRTKNGVYLEKSNYDELMNNNEIYKTEILENTKKNESMSAQIQVLNDNLAKETSLSARLNEELKLKNDRIVEMNIEMDIQKEKESQLLSESESQKNLISFLEKSMLTAEQKQESLLKTLQSTIENNLSIQINKITTLLDTPSKDIKIDADITKIKSEIIRVIKSIQSVVRMQCESLAKSLDEKSQRLSDSKEHSKDLDEITSTADQVQLKLKGLTAENSLLSKTINNNILSNCEKFLVETMSNHKAFMELQQHDLIQTIGGLISTTLTTNNNLMSNTFQDMNKMIVGEKTKILDHKQRWMAKSEGYISDMKASVHGISEKSETFDSKLNNKFFDIDEKNMYNLISLKDEVKQMEDLGEFSNEDFENSELHKAIVSVQGKFKEVAAKHEDFTNELNGINSNLTEFKKLNYNQINDNKLGPITQDSQLIEESPRKINTTKSRLFLPTIQTANLSPKKKDSKLNIQKPIVPSMSNPTRLVNSDDKENMHKRKLEVKESQNKKRASSFVHKRSNSLTGTTKSSIPTRTGL